MPTTCTIWSTPGTSFCRKWTELCRDAPQGSGAVVARMNLQYKTPLQCDDEFYSRLWLEKQGVRYVFHQDIYRASDERLCLKATVELVCLIQGKLGNSEDYDRAFEKYFA